MALTQLDGLAHPQRVWLLPLEWLEDSIKQGEKLEERKFDFERSDDVRRAERAKELAAGASPSHSSPSTPTLLSSR